MEMRLDGVTGPNEDGQAPSSDPSASRRQSYSPNAHHNNSPITTTGPTIEELLSVKYDTLNDAEQTDFATTIRNAILIPNNLNVSDDCLRILCNRRAQETSLVLDTTAESPEKSPEAPANCSQSSYGSEPISDQDQRCARELADVATKATERRTLRKVSPLPKGLIISGIPILNGENSSNAVFNRIGDAANALDSPCAARAELLSFNGRIPGPSGPRPDHVVIQIEADTLVGRVSVDGSTGAALTPATATDQADQQAKVVEDKDKSNAIQESFEFTNERSPDLFADEEDDEEEEEELEVEAQEYGHFSGDLLKRQELETEDMAVGSAVDRLMERDNHLLKRLQTAFSGVLPPPSVTNVAISLDVIVSRYKEFNGQLPEAKPRQKGDGGVDEELYLMKSVDSPTRAKTESWPEVKNVICQDVYFNLSNAIEQFEYLTVKYRSRFSGSDTASSFVLADLSSAKKRANRTKALNSNNSPGRRLSHLARRRAIFSCANLQGAKDAAAQAQQAAVDQSRVAHRQILLPVRRGMAVRKRKTPGSSAKKRGALAASMARQQQQQRREVLTRETSKRALFQSPGSNKGAEQQQPVKPKVTPEVAIRVDKSKRALFSSPKFGRYPTFSGSGSTTSGAGSSRIELSKLRYNSMTSLTMRGSQESLVGKRRRGDFSDEDEENLGEQYNKVLRTESPRRSSIGSAADTSDGGNGSFQGLSSSGGGLGRSSFMRSQSFTAEQLHRQKSSLPRTTSDMQITGSSRSQVLALNEGEKKKLLWVVSQTLLRNQVDGKNAKFKDYATVMAKVVKRLYLETVNRTASSVTEQMNRLANNIAFQVMQNKNELEIYSAEKLRTQAMNRKKLTGYVNSLEYEQYKATVATATGSRMRRLSSGVFSEASSISLSQCSVVSGMSMIGGGHVSVDENYSQAAAESSSTVLRENVDTEQRQRLSSQKNVSLVFNGKDQKNVSPYSAGDGSKRKLLVGGAVISSTGPSAIAKGLNVIKAKRQISFDA